jgi:KipI family sensor histidine kinase inhibitor
MIRSRPAGDAAVLFDTSDPPAWLAAAINAAELPGVLDVVPGARTVLVIAEPGSIPMGELAQAVARLPVAEPPGAETGLVEIPVSYDGPDLADVAELAGMTVEDVIAAHSGGLYTVGWLGFAPGFGYLTGLDQRLSGVPRLDTPRVSVPAGSVAIAAGLAAVYPSVSPGGWRLLGRTAVRTWDVDHEPAALFSPGTKVRFIAEQSAVTALVRDRPAQTGPEPRPAPEPTAGPRIEVVRPGPFATVQDLGRRGAAVGVPPSGAADSASLIWANRLVGNPDGAAGIELTLGRAVLRCFGDLRLAVTGAPAAVTLAVEPDQSRQPPSSSLPSPSPSPSPSPRGTLAVEFGASVRVPDGGLVSIGAPTAGLRTYLAVAGGLATPAVLGSRSADVLSGLGGGALRTGNMLAVGSERRQDSAPPPPRSTIPPRGDVARLRIIGGPRLDWFGADALDLLCGSIYTVSPASNRTGLRLSGPPLPRLTGRELPSEGMVTGSIEVPPDGQPILLLADHPTVGGYPVVAVVTTADAGLAAQLRPGDKVRFTTAQADLLDDGVTDLPVPEGVTSVTQDPAVPPATSPPSRSSRQSG